MHATLLQEQAQLAQHRRPGMPPIRVVTEMPQSDQWAVVEVEVPFAAANDVLGVQVDRTIVRWVQIDEYTWIPRSSSCMKQSRYGRDILQCHATSQHMSDVNSMCAVLAVRRQQWYMVSTSQAF
jgi:hypothetical protein